MHKNTYIYIVSYQSNLGKLAKCFENQAFTPCLLIQ